MLLTWYDVAAASVLVLIAVFVSWRLGLKLGKTILIASVRTVVQLGFIGLILAWVFARESWYEVLAILSIMTIIAAVSARGRITKPYKGLLLDNLLSLTIATGIVTAAAIGLILKISPWYSPQYIIPILGLILGNSLTAVSLTTRLAIDNIHANATEIRMKLALSATPFEACRRIIIHAISQGMTPTINAMMVVGIVSLPGMMTGQILAGADPSQAVRYQIITMFFICAASALSCTISALLVVRRLFDKQWRLKV